MNNKIEPLRNTEHFKQAEHDYFSFSAIVPGNLDKETLENKDYWVHFAHKLRAGCEIRCLADDNSFVAYMIVLFVSGTETKIRCTNFVKLERTVENLDEPVPGYLMKNRGRAGWWIQIKATGEKLFDGKHWPSYEDAVRDLKEYVQALGS